MKKCIIDYFHKNYFDEGLPFEYRIACIFFVTSFILSLLSFISNLIIGLMIQQTAIAFVFILMCGVFAFVSVNRKKQLIKPLLLFISFLYLPYMFFQTEGINGTILLFVVVGIFMNSIVFRGRARVLLVAANILLFLCFCILFLLNRELFLLYPSSHSRVMDFCISIVMAAVSIAVMSVSIVKSHNREQEITKALLVELEKTNNALSELSIRDPLTGIYNRRYFMELLEMELAACQNNGTQAVLIMMDIDHFKKINDTLGHAFGDEVLIQSAKEIVRQVRTFEKVARYGGEEFIVILPQCSLDMAFSVAERIRKSISELSFRNEAHVTLSLGLADFQRNDTPLELIQRADKALYSAKDNGRNCTMLWERSLM